MSGQGSKRFYTLDVFTTERFGGNPLAVVPDATGLTTEQMQTIAREFNLSETSFVLPPRADGTHHVRIFTPASELPFAGHPTVGTALLLNELDGKASTGQRLVFEEGVGNVIVEVRCEGGTCFAELEVAQPVEVRPSPLNVNGLAALLSLSPSDIDVNAPAPTAASCGVRFLLVPLASVDALARSRLDLTRWAADLQNTWAPQVYPYVLIDGRAGGNVRVRMFSPAFGIPEDPATGSAAAAFAAFMASLDPNAGDRKWTIQQGIEMGRPSTLYARSARRADGSTGVYVGGHAVRVSEGSLLL